MGLLDIFKGDILDRLLRSTPMTDIAEKREKGNQYGTIRSPS